MILNIRVVILRIGIISLMILIGSGCVSNRGEGKAWSVYYERIRHHGTNRCEVIMWPVYEENVRGDITQVRNKMVQSEFRVWKDDKGVQSLMKRNKKDVDLINSISNRQAYVEIDDTDDANEIGIGALSSLFDRIDEERAYFRTNKRQSRVRHKRNRIIERECRGGYRQWSIFKGLLWQRSAYGCPLLWTNKETSWSTFDLETRTHKHDVKTFGTDLLFFSFGWQNMYSFHKHIPFLIGAKVSKLSKWR